MEFNSLLADYFCHQYNISNNAKLTIEEVDARELIVPERIDIIAKLKYIELREKGYDLTFIKELYKAHIESFSLGTFTEPGNDNKNSVNIYFNIFDSLIDNIKEVGFDKQISVIPVGGNNAIIDGSHRVAIAIYFKLKVSIIRFDNISVNYNADFFRSRLLKDSYIDYLIAEYCRIKDNLYFLCIWPKARGENNKIKMHSQIQQSNKIVYMKNVKLNYDGLSNFIIQIYSSQSWLGNIENHFSGARNKADACFDENGVLTTYIIESNCLAKILKLKESIRNIFNIENHSIHITDNQPETVLIEDLLLNQNSIDFLNKGKPNYYPKLNRKLTFFKTQLLNNSFPLDLFVIDSSSTMGLYGLRDVDDIDFITISNGYEVIENNYINNHHDYIDNYEMSKDSLILNPNNYFVYREMKFVTLGLLHKFKKNRNGIKDKVDVKLIDNILNVNFNFKLTYFKFQYWALRRKRNMKYIIKFRVILLLKRYGYYEVTKKAYDKLLRRKV